MSKTKEELVTKLLETIESFDSKKLDHFFKVNSNELGYNIQKTALSKPLRVFVHYDHYTILTDFNPICRINRSIIFKSKIEKLIDRVISNIKKYLHEKELNQINDILEEIRK